MHANTLSGGRHDKKLPEAFELFCVCVCAYVRRASLYSFWAVQEIVLTLLRYDACASIINGTAQVPRNFTEDDEIITMLEGTERPGPGDDDDLNV